MLWYRIWCFGWLSYTDISIIDIHIIDNAYWSGQLWDPQEALECSIYYVFILSTKSRIPTDQNGISIQFFTPLSASEFSPGIFDFYRRAISLIHYSDKRLLLDYQTRNKRWKMARNFKKIGTEFSFNPRAVIVRLNDVRLVRITLKTRFGKWIPQLATQAWCSDIGIVARWPVWDKAKAVQCAYKHQTINFTGLPPFDRVSHAISKRSITILSNN